MVVSAPLDHHRSSLAPSSATDIPRNHQPLNLRGAFADLEQSLDRMIEEAQNLGANAIVGVRFSTSEVAAHAAEILAYGTAVIVE